MRLLASVLRASCTMLSSSLTKSLPSLAAESRRLVLLRHGETDWNAQGKMQGGGFDIPLNDNGRKQAASVAQVLRGMALDVVASSHLARATQTADIIVSELQQPSDNVVRVSNADFGEMRFGHFEGATIRGPESTEEVKANLLLATSKLLGNVNAEYPGGGESTLQVATRARQGLDSLLTEYPNAQTICVVGHGRMNKILLAALLFDNVLEFDEIRQGNTCINVLDMDLEGKWTAHVLNSVEHVHPQVKEFL